MGIIGGHGNALVSGAAFALPPGAGVTVSARSGHGVCDAGNGRAVSSAGAAAAVSSRVRALRGVYHSSAASRHSARVAVSMVQGGAGDDGKKIKVAVLGATGSVGQRFIELLGGHPWFEVVALGASQRSAGKTYEQACRWKQAVPIPSETRGVMVSECDPALDAFKDVKIVFSGLDNEVAGDIEEAFAKTGKAVFSNAKNHRMDPDVPILIPTVNAAHIDALPAQIKARNFNGGFLVTNANCSTTVMTIGLKPIMEKFGIEKIFVTTMQAISGAGYPGLPSMDIIDNVVPYIGSEEEKMESESKKIYGSIDKDGKFVDAGFVVSAMCNRVHVLDGHLEAISLKLKTPATPEQIIETIKAYPSVTKQLGLPSAPEKDVVYNDSPDRPQTRLDRMLGGGFTVSVGRVRKCNINDIRLVCLGHNTIVGAAGGSIINAELCVAKGLISRE